LPKVASLINGKGKAMQLLAYVTAAIISIIVFVSLNSLQQRNQGATLNTTEYRAAKKGALSTAAFIERDFKNIASNFPAYPLDPDTAIVGLDTTSATRYFEFWAQTMPGQAPDLVRYEWIPAGTTQLKNETVPVFQLFRRVNGETTGMSIGLMTKFQLRLQESSGVGVATLKDTRQIVVDMRLVSGFGVGDGKLIEETMWNSVFHPVGMTRSDL
jgi:hypothetical protein